MYMYPDTAFLAEVSFILSFGYFLWQSSSLLIQWRVFKGTPAHTGLINLLRSIRLNYFNQLFSLVLEGSTSTGAIKVVWIPLYGSPVPAGRWSKGVFLTQDQSSGSGFGPPGYGSVIVCTDPEPTPDPDPSINKQKKPWFQLFCDFLMAFFISGDSSECTYSK